MTQTILITGGTGFVGSHLVEALLAQGHAEIHVTSFSDSESYLHTLLPAKHIHPLNLTDSIQTQSLVKELKPTQIYHLAAYAAVGDSFQKTKEILENNLILQLNVLDTIKEYAPQSRTLIIGSAMEYDLAHLATDAVDENVPLGPTSPYGVSKVLQDLLSYAYFQSYQLNVVRVRPFNHIGERQSPDFAIPAFAKQIVAIERGQQDSLKVGNVDSVRDFTDVRDMVQAYVLLMEKGVAGEVYNIGTGRGYTMAQILDMLSELAHAEVRVETDPSRLRPSDVPKAVANASKIKKIGWKATIPLKETLTRILDYWRQQP